MSQTKKGYNELYPKILAVYKATKGADYCQQLAQSKWKELKQYKKTPEVFNEKYDEYHESLQIAIDKINNKQNKNKKMTSFFKVITTKKQNYSDINSHPQNESMNDSNVSIFRGCNTI